MVRKKKVKPKKNKYVINIHSIIEKEIKDNDLRESFSSRLIKYAESIANKPTTDHEDFTHIPFITIDGKFSQDFDDAIYVKINDNSCDIYIAIADVSHFVKPNDLIDLEAKKRANSFYFPDRVLPMLPGIISNDTCSLLPNKSRACLMVKTNINLNGKLNFYEIKRVKIKSVARLNYENVEKHLKRINQFSCDLGNLVNNAFKAYRILKKSSDLRTKLNFNSESFNIEIQDSKFKIKKKNSLISEKIIEELMIHANVTVARFLLEKKIESYFRNHEEPSDEKINRFRIFCDQNFINFSPGKKVLQKDFIALIESSPMNTKIFIEFILKSQSKAYYDSKNKGHFGLALDKYVHFTSPIRRYSDLQVHRDIVVCLRNEKKKKDKVNPFSFCNHLTNQEKKAEKIERNILSKACCLILNKQKKKKYTGYIDGFIEKGIFIKAFELPFYGFQKFDSLTDDFYIFDENEQCAIGQKNGMLFKLGEKVTFKLKKINSNTGKILINGLKKEADDKI